MKSKNYKVWRLTLKVGTVVVEAQPGGREAVEVEAHPGSRGCRCEGSSW